jgi:hypothetical protein
MPWWVRLIFTVASAMVGGLVVALVASGIYAATTNTTFLTDSDTGDTVAGLFLMLGIALGTAFGIVWRRTWIKPPSWHWEPVPDDRQSATAEHTQG